MAALLCGFTMSAHRPGLTFGADGKFKIVQFTDTHLRAFNVEEEKSAYERMGHVIDEEKPDLVLISGDVITARPAAPAWQKLVEFLDSKKTPWFIVFGNHDHQQDLTKAEMAAITVTGKYTLNTLNSRGELADIEIPVKSSKGKDIPFYVYGLDSHDFSDVVEDHGYDWFTPAQVQWLRDCCTKRTAKDGTIAPSLAFFHIPLREYIDAWSPCDNPREYYKPADAPTTATTGIRGESICCGGLNTGMFAAMRETGSVMGTFVGHDHNNDFIAVYYGIALGYGRFSGSNTVYNNLPQGARVFVVKEGQRAFETWIREDGDRFTQHVLFDGKNLISAKRDRAAAYGVWSDIEW